MKKPSPEEIAAGLNAFKQTRAFKEKEKQLKWIAVCLVGNTEPIPKRNSNRMVWPVKIVASKDPESAADRADLEQSQYELVTLEWVWTISDAHARRLRVALIEELDGPDPQMVRLRHGYRDCGANPKRTWKRCLDNAQIKMRARGEPVECYSEEMRLQYFANEIRRGRGWRLDAR